MLLTQAPLGIAGQAALLPAVALCCVWFWSVFRPHAMPPPVVFLIGLLLDLLGYLPLGVGVFTLLVAARRRLAMRWLAVKRGFAWIWHRLLRRGRFRLDVDLAHGHAADVPSAAARTGVSIGCPDRRALSGARNPSPARTLDRQPGTRLMRRSARATPPLATRPMKRDVKRTGVFTRRALLLMGGQLAVLGSLGACLYQVQVVRARATRHWRTKTASAPA